MAGTMTLRDGSEDLVFRCYFPTPEQLAAQGDVIGWVDENGDPVDNVPDRLNQRYSVRMPDGRIRISCPLYATGLEVLTLDDAMRLGFSTSEYQAALRFRLLNVELIQTEEELAAEQIAPRDEVEASFREGAYHDRTEWSQARKVPYPQEHLFQRYQAIGWVEGDPDDRLRSEYIVRDVVTNDVWRSGVWLCDVGLESLSMEDAFRLGFDTIEYQTALRTRILERRHLQDEEDLAVAVFPPYEVQDGLENFGRRCSYRFDEGFLWTEENWERLHSLREWILRRGRAEIHTAERPPKATRIVDAVDFQSSPTPF